MSNAWNWLGGVLKSPNTSYVPGLGSPPVQVGAPLAPGVSPTQIGAYTDWNSGTDSEREENLVIEKYRPEILEFLKDQYPEEFV